VSFCDRSSDELCGPGFGARVLVSHSVLVASERDDERRRYRIKKVLLPSGLIAVAVLIAACGSNTAPAGKRQPITFDL
jgi:hypothetical protein